MKKLAKIFLGSTLLLSLAACHVKKEKGHFVEYRTETHKLTNNSIVYEYTFILTLKESNNQYYFKYISPTKYTEPIPPNSVNFVLSNTESAWLSRNMTHDVEAKITTILEDEDVTVTIASDGEILDVVDRYEFEPQLLNGMSDRQIQNKDFNKNINSRDR